MSLYALDNEFWEKHLLLLERARFLPLLCVQRAVERCLEVVQKTQQQLEELRVSRLSKQQRAAEQQRLQQAIAEERVNEERKRMAGEDVYAHLVQYMHEHILAVKEVTVLCETNITTGLTQRIRRRLRREKEGKAHDQKQNQQKKEGHDAEGNKQQQQLPWMSAHTSGTDAFALHRKVQRLVAITQELDKHCRASSSNSGAGGNDGALTARSFVTDHADDEGQLDLTTIRQMVATLVAEGLQEEFGGRSPARTVFQGILLNAITVVLNTQGDEIFPRAESRSTDSSIKPEQEEEEDWSWLLTTWLTDPNAAKSSSRLTPIVQMTVHTQRLKVLKALLSRRPQFALVSEIWDNLVQLLGTHGQEACRFNPSQNALMPQDVVENYICATFDAVACAITCVVGYDADRQQAAARTLQLLQKLEWSLVFRCAYVHIFNAYLQVSFLSLLVAKCRADELACCEAKVRIAFWSMPVLEDYQPEHGGPPPSFQLNQFKQAAHDVAVIAKAILRAMATHASSGVVQWHGLMALRYVLAPRQSHDQSLRVRVGVMVVEDLLSADEVGEEHRQEGGQQLPSQEQPQDQQEARSDMDRDADGEPRPQSHKEEEKSDTPPNAAELAPLTRRLSSRGPSRQNSTMNWLVDPTAVANLADYPKEMQPVSKPIQQLLPQIAMEHMHVPEVLEQWLLTTYALFRRTRVVQLWLASMGTEALTSRALLLHSRDAYITALVQMFAGATKR